MTKHNRPIRFAGSLLGESRHVCAFFATADDEYSTIMPFTRDGIDAGERVVHVMPADRRDHIERIRRAGVDVDRANERRQLQVLRSADAYLIDGRFDGTAMLSVIQRVLDAGRDLGFPLTRLVAHAEHVFEDPKGADDFLEYESRLGYLLPDYPDPVVCTYDLNLISAGVAMDVLRTHPTVIIGGILQENPFFVPPNQFLRELEHRRLTGSMALVDDRGGRAKKTGAGDTSAQESHRGRQRPGRGSQELSS